MLAKRICSVLLCIGLLFAMCLFPVQAKSREATPLSDFIYELQPSGKVLLTQYVGQSSTVVVPGAYTIEQTEHSVELASKSVFAKNTSITSVTLCPGVSFQNNAMEYLFYGCEALKRIEMTAVETGSITTMKAMLAGCKKLSRLTGYENWDTGSLKTMAYMFDGTASLESVDLSRWKLARVESTAWCFQNCGARKILLPDDLGVISAGFLNHASNYAGGTFTVPAGVKTVGYAHTFYDFATDDFTEFRVDKGNEHYKAVDGILCSADGTQLLAIPRGKTFPDGILQIPEGITFLGELSFSRNSHIQKLVLPNSYVLDYIALNDPAYITSDDTGNLNAGLNLNIAVYSYTGIRAYEVLPDNPIYQSIDGIIYSKDMTALEAVPTRYEGYLQIPEGVRVWKNGAMWCAGDSVAALMKGCTGVFIPASMTDIGIDQLDKLNRIKRTVPGFTISVSEKNPVYYLGGSGELMKKPLLADMQITLEEASVVYDGTQKTPVPIIVHKGRQLVLGEDYTVQYANNVNAGTAWLRITALAEQYGSTECTFTIEPAVPEYTLPETLSLQYGQTLAELALPQGFSWTEPETVAAEVGEQICCLNYTREDPNYVDVTGIQVAVQIIPKQLGSESFFLPLWHPWIPAVAEPELTVMDGDAIVPREAYTLTYENNRGIGIATVTVEDVPGGNYNVSGSKDFLILPGPEVAVVCLTVLWCLTTGRACARKKTAGLSRKQPKNR